MNTANQNYEYNNKVGPHAINFFFNQTSHFLGCGDGKDNYVTNDDVINQSIFFLNIKLAISISLRGLFFFFFPF